MAIKTSDILVYYGVGTIVLRFLGYLDFGNIQIGNFQMDTLYLLAIFTIFMGFTLGKWNWPTRHRSYPNHTNLQSRRIEFSPKKPECCPYCGLTEDEVKALGYPATITKTGLQVTIKGKFKQSSFETCGYCGATKN